MRGRGYPLAGIGCMVAATSVFAVMDALVKALMADYPVVEVLFFRAAFAFLPLAPLLWAAGRTALVTARPWAHVVRSSIGIAAVTAFFLAFGALPLAQVTAIAFAAPLLMTALSVPVLGEVVGRKRWAAVILGFGGILLITRATPPAAGLGLTAALAGTLLYAMVMVLIRQMSTTERPVTIVAWFTIACTIASGAALPWHWVTPTIQDGMLLASVGVLGGLGQILITQALRLAPVSTVAPFDYLHMVYAVAFGWLFWGEVPDPRMLAGAGLIVACGLYVLHREARKPSA
ncbi:MAG: DMT family transporter [Alphaproteobacteria bacterium]|nr:DMT family transporter [Alphaproteobacteria bacterium]